MEATTCDQLKRVTTNTFLFYTLTKKEVHMKTETQGCRFMFSSFSGRPKKSDVSVRKILVPNSMPVF